MEFRGKNKRKLTNSEKKKIIRNSIIIGLLLILSIVLIILLMPYIKMLSSEDGIKVFQDKIKSFGIWGVLVCIFIQVLQIVIAFIPGQVVEMVVPCLFSPLPSLIIFILGSAIATVIIFFLGRALGRPFINLFVRKEDEEKYDFVFKSKKLDIIFFILFLIPMTPKDVLIYFLPLLNISLSKFLVITVVARIPGWLLDIYLANSITQNNYLLTIIMTVVIILIIILCFVYKDKIFKYLKDEGEKNMKLLVVVDFQNDFVDGALGFPKAKELEDKIADKIMKYRENKDDVLFTFDTHFDNYLETQEGVKLPVKHCLKGSEGHKLYGKINDLVTKKDKKIEKEVFGSSELGLYLKKKKYSEIEFVGLVSNICVISNCVIARTFSKESKIIVDAKCTSSFDESLNEKCLDILEGLQVEVINRLK